MLLCRGEPLSAYTALKFNPWSNTSKYCDVVVDKPVIFVQLDFGGNMYHHFCDFFNLYLTQMANNSNFHTDNQIVRWDLVSSGTYLLLVGFGKPGTVPVCGWCP